MLFLVLPVQGQQNQNIPVMDFPTLEPWLHKSDDTTYILNFWATWCVPCRRELPHFERIHREHSGDALKVVLVSLDFPQQIESTVIPFLEKNSITAQVILLNDPNSNVWIDKVDTSWSGSIPATLLYNREKRIFLEKELDYEKIREILNEFINP